MLVVLGILFIIYNHHVTILCIVSDLNKITNTVIRLYYYIQNKLKHICNGISLVLTA